MFTSVLIILLICIFIYILLAQFIGYREGMETAPKQTYEPYNQEDAYILSKQNAGNIEYLKGRLPEIDQLTKDVRDISGNLLELSKTVDQLIDQQAEYAKQSLPTTDPDISGAEFDENEDENEDEEDGNYDENQYENE
jgi:hypothetical protein